MTGEVPRLDGLYVNLGENYWNYIRFSQGGKVSQVSASAGAPYEVFKWLTPDDSQLSQGTYTTENGSIQFITASSAGEVVYQGQVMRNSSELHLNSYSRINGRRSEVFYIFMPVQADRGTRSSQGRFSIMSKASGQLSIGPRVSRIDGDYWPVINFSITDGRQGVSVDFPIEAAPAIVAEIEKIIKEYDNGSDISRNWEMPM